MNAAIATVSNTSSLVLFKKNITEAVQNHATDLSGIKKVDSPAAKAEAEARLIAAKKTRKVVEEIRKSETVKLDDKKKEIMLTEREFAAFLDSEISRVEGSINAWNNAELARVREEQKKIREEAEAKAKRLRNETSIVNNEIAAQVKTQAVQATAPTSIATEWVLSGVTNPTLVPREFLMVDEAKVKAAIKSGRRDIPGLAIVERARRTGR